MIILFISFIIIASFLFEQSKVTSKKFIVFSVIYLTFASFLFLSAFSITAKYTLKYSLLSIFCSDCKKISVETILDKYKNDDITNRVKNYITIWNELLDATTETQLKKALVKSHINSDCMLYAFNQDDSKNGLNNMFLVKADIKKSFSSKGIKYIKVQVLAETYSVGFMNNNISDFISKKINTHNDSEEESICKYNSNTEMIFQKLLHNSDFKKIYYNFKL